MMGLLNNQREPKLTLNRPGHHDQKYADQAIKPHHMDPQAISQLNHLHDEKKNNQLNHLA